MFIYNYVSDWLCTATLCTGLFTCSYRNSSNTNNTNKNASVTVQRKEQPKQNTLELFVITILVTILILFFVGIVHKDLKYKKRDVEHLLVSQGI